MPAGPQPLRAQAVTVPSSLLKPLLHPQPLPLPLHAQLLHPHLRQHTRARIRATAKLGTDPTIMLTGPVPVTEKILRDSGMSIKDIDLFEVNEAFASVVLRFQHAFNVDPARVNVNGGSIAMGHPLGATGAIIIGTLLDELERTGKSTGLATLCIASGMGAATIIERV